MVSSLDAFLLYPVSIFHHPPIPLSPLDTKIVDFLGLKDDE
jgi:hypothetical protein